MRSIVLLWCPGYHVLSKMQGRHLYLQDWHGEEYQKKCHKAKDTKTETPSKILKETGAEGDFSRTTRQRGFYVYIVKIAFDVLFPTGNRSICRNIVDVHTAFSPSCLMQYIIKSFICKHLTRKINIFFHIRAFVRYYRYLSR